MKTIMSAKYFLVISLLGSTLTSVSMKVPGVSSERKPGYEEEYEFRVLISDIGAKKVDFKTIETKASTTFPRLSEKEQDNLVVYSINLIAFTNALTDQTEKMSLATTNTFLQFIGKEREKINKVLKERNYSIENWINMMKSLFQ